MYQVLAHPLCDAAALRLQAIDPVRFVFHKSTFAKFEDSRMDHIELGGFTPVNRIKGRHVLFLACFKDNDAIQSQISALIVLCESFIKSLTVFLPFFPQGTMERVTTEGVVATASTIARQFSSLPSPGVPTRVMVYDIHTLQNRFYFFGAALATLHSGIPLLLDVLRSPGNVVDAIAFPDDGAAKRFGALLPGFPHITCGKVRIGEQRVVTVQDGLAAGLRVLIVDDMVRTGGTLVKCAEALVAVGAVAVSVFCTHAAFAPGVVHEFSSPAGKYFGVFDKFFVTNSIAFNTDALTAPFCVLDLVPLLTEDL